jgi:hypothetical protein
MANTILTDEQIRSLQEASQRLVEQQNELLKQAKEIENVRERITKELEAEQQLLKKQEETYEAMFQLTTKTQELQQVKNKLAEQEAKIQETIKQIKQAQEISDQNLENSLKQKLSVERSEKDTLKEQLKDKKEILDLAEKQKKEAEKIFQAEKKITEEEEKQLKIIKQKEEEIRKKLGQSLDNLGKKITDISKSLLDGFNIPLLGTRISGLRDMIMQVVEAPVKAFKEFGNLDQFMPTIGKMREGLRELGVSEDEAFKAFGDLTQQVAEFSSYSESTQRSLITTASVLDKAGISTKTFGKQINDLTKVFGMLPQQAEKTALKLAALSKTLQDGNKSTEDFTALTPKLVGFGTRAVDVFEKTAIAAKKLGMETKELFGIMDQYDSFEKAADAAGELNIALGGQFVDTLELMNLSLEKGPVETLKYLQNAFDQSGVSLENLNRAQIKYFASAAKMDEKQFMQVFQNGARGVEDYIRQQEIAEKKQNDLNKVSEKTQTILTQLQNAFNAAFASEENVNALVNLIKSIVELSYKLVNIIKYFKDLVPLMASVFAAGKIIQFTGAIMKAGGAMAFLRQTTIAQAIANAVALAFANPLAALGGLAVAGLAAFTVYKLVGSATGGESGGVFADQEKVKGSVNAAKGTGGVAPVPKGDAVVKLDPKDSITPVGGGTAIASKSDGDFILKLDKMISVLVEIRDKNTKTVVELDGRTLAESIATTNARNPYIG